MRYTETQVTSELLDHPEFAGEPRKIFICSTPRSGSYMLCRYMIHAGLGVPHEYFNPIIMRDIAPRLGLGSEIKGLKWRWRTLQDRLPFSRPERAREAEFLKRYIGALIPRRCQNGIFAAKIHFDQYIRVLDNTVGLQLLNGGVFIYIFRENLLRQAISRNFSYITGRWGIDDTVTTAPMPRSDLLDAKGIDREVGILSDEDREWRLFLARNGLAPITVSYEQLCKNPNAIIMQIAERVGLDAAVIRNDYRELAIPDSDNDPTLPTKNEVLQNYLTTVRKLRPFEAEKNPHAKRELQPAK